jgi:hypothetical protein
MLVPETVVHPQANDCPARHTALRQPDPCLMGLHGAFAGHSTEKSVAFAATHETPFFYFTFDVFLFSS